MSFSLHKILTISRTRFWIYLVGTYAIGLVSTGQLTQVDTHTVYLLVALFLFFTLPANLFIYGVNDIYDYETDKLNSKKQNYEALVEPSEQRHLWKIIDLMLLPFVVMAVWLSWQSLVVLTIFLFSGLFYSAPPIRAKARPPLDILFSSVIYISPALVGFLAAGGQSLSYIAVLGGLLWASAMQTYSAVPDIQADTAAGIQTLATLLGRRGALVFCLFAYGLSAWMGWIFLGNIALAMGALYLLMVVSALISQKKTFWLYEKFLWVNALFGFIIWWALFLQEKPVASILQTLGI